VVLMKSSIFWDIMTCSPILNMGRISVGFNVIGICSIIQNLKFRFTSPDYGCIIA
jgi:hypothetical protein